MRWTLEGLELDVNSRWPTPTSPHSRSGKTPRPGYGRYAWAKLAERLDEAEILLSAGVNVDVVRCRKWHA